MARARRGALAGWGMTGAAIYDATNKGPEVISLTMTPVMMVYSSLFSWWAFVVKPQNLLLCACHASNVVAQANQLRRAVEHKLEKGEGDEVLDLAMKAAAGAVGVDSLAGGRSRRCSPRSRWRPFGPRQFRSPSSPRRPPARSPCTSGRPCHVDDVAHELRRGLGGSRWNHKPRAVRRAQARGSSSRRAPLLIAPQLHVARCVALFGGSAWHLGRKVNADYIGGKDPPKDCVNR